MKSGIDKVKAPKMEGVIKKFIHIAEKKHFLSIFGLEVIAPKTSLLG